MSKRNKIGRSVVQVLGAAAMLTFVAAGLGEAQQKTRCTVDMAMSALASEDKTAICDCEIVTIGFVRYLQRRSDVGGILADAAEQCSALAVVISETPVAGFFSNEYIAQDPKGAAPGSCSEAECGNENVATVFDPVPVPEVVVIEEKEEPDCQGADWDNPEIC